MKKENELNNGWVNEQDKLRAGLEKADEEKQKLYDRVKYLEQTLQANNRKGNMKVPARKNAKEQEEVTRMHFNNETCKVFFSKKSEMSKPEQE